MASEGDGVPAESGRDRPAVWTPGVDVGRDALRKRVPLGSNRRRLSYERRLRLWLLLFAVPIVGCVALLAWMETQSARITLAAAALAAVFALFPLMHFFEQITRPLQTLANVVAALREDDFSFRARGARRGDSLGDLALEINSLAAMLQAQRSAARDALTLAERVMSAMRTPVLAFAADQTLRLLNPAAERSFGLQRSAALGRAAQEFGLGRLLTMEDGAVYAQAAGSGAGTAGETRWVVRRSGFRLGGVPHTLVVLSDVDAVLREEERVAWQRLVRVLSHEINNSLTPITSVAGSLRGRLPPATDENEPAQMPVETLRTLQQGLRLIEDRAFSLHRFVHAYQRLTRMPKPVLESVAVRELVSRAVGLEDRVRARVLPGPELTVMMDAGQIEQLLINLLRNAAEAALSLQQGEDKADVCLTWLVSGSDLLLRVEDNGPGLSDSSNLFVPFYTTKPGGSGIGLVLAQQIAQAHKGELTLYSRIEQTGCVAELRLPLS